MRSMIATQNQTQEINQTPGQFDADPGFTAFDHMKFYGQAAIGQAMDSLTWVADSTQHRAFKVLSTVGAIAATGGALAGNTIAQEGDAQPASTGNQATTRVLGPILPNVSRAKQEQLEKHFKKVCKSAMIVAPWNSNHVHDTGSVERTDELNRNLINDGHRQQLSWKHKAGRKLCALFIHRFDGTTSVLTRENTPKLEGKTSGKWTDNYPLSVQQAMQSAEAYMGPKK
jgi:hypothetical protein